MNFADKIKSIFENFGVVDGIVTGIELLLLIFVIYFLFVFLKYNNNSKLVYFFVAISMLAVIFTLFDFTVLSVVFLLFLCFSWIFVIVIYNPSIKRFFWNMSNRQIIKNISRDYQCTDEDLMDSCDNIIKALQGMAKKETGALIVLTPSEIPPAIIQSGVLINAVISNELIETIFSKKTPLHDGAVFIKANKIIAAGCFLPLTQELNIPKELGTRHRAAIGISEQTDFLAIAVSEETGIISLAQKGELTRFVDAQMLKEKIFEVYGIKNSVDAGKKDWNWTKS